MFSQPILQGSCLFTLPNNELHPFTAINKMSGNRMPDADVTAGLVLPNAAVAMLGKGGAAATLLLIFMAVTSASSAEYIAVSSIFTYDIYQTYWKPTASGKMLINMAHS